MPYSLPGLDPIINTFIRDNIPPNKNIIDIGCGAGKYYNMLHDAYPNIDGIEVHQPYIDEWKLTEAYRNVFNINCIQFSEYQNYDLAIMGDILEHLSIDDTLIMLQKLEDANCKLVVKIPYQMRQGICFDNKHEIHLQDDLTPTLMSSRYGKFLDLHTKIIDVGNTPMGFYVSKW